MTAILCQNLRANNDTNGNPRRVWVSYSSDGAVVDVHDEGYIGKPSIMRHLPELPAITTNGPTYRSWMKVRTDV